MSRKTIIVGQAPSRTSAGNPAFSGKSGPRLAEMLGVEHRDLWKLFEVVNVLDFYPGPDAWGGDVFPLEAAKTRAAAMKSSFRGRRVVYVGKNVARAFGASVGYFEWGEEMLDQDSFRFCVIPHPSGVSRFWNAEENVVRARTFGREIPR